MFNLLSSSPLTPPSFHSPGKASLKTVMAAVPVATSQSSLRTTGRATCANLKRPQPSFPRPTLLETGLRQPAGGRVFQQHVTPLFLPCSESLALSPPALQLNAGASSRLLSRSPCCPLQSLQILTFTQEPSPSPGSQT